MIRTRLIRFLRNLPVRRKLTLMSFIVSGVAIVFSLGVLMVWLMSVQVGEATEDLAALSDAVGESCLAALAFNSKDDTETVLKTLKSKASVRGAAVYRKEGTLFCFVGLNSEQVPALKIDSPATLRNGMDIRIRKPLRIDGALVGYLVVDADIHGVIDKLRRVFLVAMAVASLAGLAAVATLAPIFHRILAGPLVYLTGLVREVGERKDFSMRALVLGSDEVGQLSESFNLMMGKIQEQARSQERSETRYRLLFESSPLPVLIVDRKSRMIVGANSATEFHYGINRAQISRMQVTDLFHPSTPPEEVQQVVVANELRNRSAKHRRSDGSDMHVEMTAQRLDLDGEDLVIVLIQDVTRRRIADAALADANERLIKASRQAGMAEVATGVLHNVGNVLNSVNVSLGVIREKLETSRVAKLAKACDLISANRANLGEYLVHDPKGAKLPEYLISLSASLQKERDDLQAEAGTVLMRIDHIKQIVATQQSFARQGGATECLSPIGLIDEALRIQEGAFQRHQVRLVRENASQRWVMADRHRTLQVLVNLLGNAKAAMSNTPFDLRKITLRVEDGEAGRVRISISDTGCGIARENLAKIFQHGFTTKKEGHGFGLHSCANAAAEMKGALSVQSEGPGTGATFVLELPEAQRPRDTNIQNLPLRAEAREKSVFA